jgi:hypothetical protein
MRRSTFVRILLALPLVGILENKAMARCGRRSRRRCQTNVRARCNPIIQLPPERVRYTVEDLGRLLKVLRNAVPSDGGPIDKAFEDVMGTPNAATPINKPEDLNDFGGEFANVRRELNQAEDDIRTLRQILQGRR